MKFYIIENVNTYRKYLKYIQQQNICATILNIAKLKNFHVTQYSAVVYFATWFKG